MPSQLKLINKKLGKIIDSIENGKITALKSLNKRIKALEVEQEVTETNLKSIDFKIADIEKDRLSTEVMCRSFKVFRDIIDKAKPAKLKELLFQIVEVVEWYENEKDTAAGHCKISYFEQPNLNLPIKKPSEPDGDQFAECMVWLPSTDSNRGPSG